MTTMTTPQITEDLIKPVKRYYVNACYATGQRQTIEDYQTATDGEDAISQVCYEMVLTPEQWEILFNSLMEPREFWVKYGTNTYAPIISTVVEVFNSIKVTCGDNECILDPMMRNQVICVGLNLRPL